VTQWAMDSFELTKYAVYSGITENTTPTADYVAKNQYLIQKQIVLGGLRLANIIYNIFGYKKTSSADVPDTFLQ